MTVEQVTERGLTFWYGEGKKEMGILHLCGFRDFAVFSTLVHSYLTVLNHQGYGVFCAPYRGILNQPGRFTFSSMISDATDFVSLFQQKSGLDDIVLVGNCVGGIPAMMAGAEISCVRKMVSVNTLYVRRNDTWWTSPQEYEKRLARWKLVEAGCKGSLGTEFNGLTKERWEVICRGEDATNIDRSLSAIAQKKCLLLVSSADKKIDPLHTWSFYHCLRNVSGNNVEIRVIPEDDDHLRLLSDLKLLEDILSWIQ